MSRLCGQVGMLFHNYIVGTIEADGHAVENIASTRFWSLLDNDLYERSWCRTLQFFSPPLNSFTSLALFVPSAIFRQVFLVLLWRRGSRWGQFFSCCGGNPIQRNVLHVHVFRREFFFICVICNRPSWHCVCGKRKSQMVLAYSCYTDQIRARELHLTRPSPCFSAGIPPQETDVFRLATKKNRPVTGACPHPPKIFNF